MRYWFSIEIKLLVILFIVKILARINIFKNITLTGKRNTIFTGKEVSSIPIIFQWTFWIMFNFPSKNVKNIFEKNNIIFAGKYRNCYNHHYYIFCLFYYPFKRQFHKMAKHTQTIRRQIADELFECVWPFCGIGAVK